MRGVLGVLVVVLCVCQRVVCFQATWMVGLPKEGRVAVQEGKHELWYRIHRPMGLSSKKGAPLLVLHGGPGVPSDYLFDLAQVDYRSTVFYDQLGCGRSAAPDKSAAQYSVEASVLDLQEVIKALGFRKYHMLGQSWGGILGYEFLKSGAGEGCQSFIISNTPTSVAQVEADAASLMDALGGDSRPDIAQAFSQAHECRLPQRPKLLVDAYAHAGTAWRGTTAIKAWQLKHDAPKLTTPTLVLRGEHDFVTEASQEAWKEAFTRLRYRCLPDTSHHTLLEARDDYLEIVDNFTAEFD